MDKCDKDYIDGKVQEVLDMFREHEKKDIEAFGKIFEAIKGSSDQAGMGLARLDAVLALVKSIHDKVDTDA